MKQKTWTDLLGPFAPEAIVRGREIVLPKIISYVTLWHFDSRSMAERCYEEWKKGN